VNSSAPTTESVTLPPDELAVTDWMKQRLAELHARHGVDAIQLLVNRFSDGTIDVGWSLHKDGACVVSRPTIAKGVRALREKLEGAARP